MHSTSRAYSEEIEIAFRQNICLMVVEKEGMILPIYEDAFSNTIGNVRKLRNRYLRALVINSSNKIYRVDGISEVKFQTKGLLDFFRTKAVEITLTDEPMTFSELISRLIVAATSKSSYSVWAQFYEG